MQHLAIVIPRCGGLQADENERGSCLQIDSSHGPRRREGSDAKRPAAKKAEVGDRRAAARSSSRIAHAWPTAKQTLSSSCKRPTWAVAAERQDVGSGPNAKTWAVAAMQSPNANFDSLRLA